jgi:hypothetical protein
MYQWYKTRSKVKQIEQIIKDHYYELDKRNHGLLSITATFKKIENILGLQYKQGEERTKRETEK